MRILLTEDNFIVGKSIKQIIDEVIENFDKEISQKNLKIIKNFKNILSKNNVAINKIYFQILFKNLLDNAINIVALLRK